MINVSNLRKTFDKIEALKGISFNIQPGECYGMLGPNGAGKTTTISIMSTLIKPNEGEINIAGYDLKKHPLECKKNIGVVTQEIALYNELSAYNNLLFWGSMYNVSGKELINRIENKINFYSRNIQGDLSKIILKCNEFGLDIQHIDIQKISLETIFLSLTGKQLRDR